MTGAGRVIEEYYPKSVFTKRYPGLEEAAEALSAAAARLAELLADMSPEELQQPVAPGKWSPGEVADHLVLVNLLFGRCVDSADGTGTARYLMPKGRLSVEGRALAALEGEPRRGRSAEELIADIRISTSALVESAWLAQERGTLDETCLVHAFFGEMSAGECAQLAAWHMVRHLRTVV